MMRGTRTHEKGYVANMLPESLSSGSISGFLSSHESRDRSQEPIRFEGRSNGFDINLGEAAQFGHAEAMFGCLAGIVEVWCVKCDIESGDALWY